MRSTLILGGTGLLGYHSALALLDAGHRVTSLSTGSLDPRSWYPADASVQFGNVQTMSTRQLTQLFMDYDSVVYALGPDDRETPRAPAAEFFNEQLVETSERVLRAAKDASVESVVVFGSYFTYFNRVEPTRGLAHRHPYIQARTEQQRRCLALADDNFSVAVLEIPYVFGLVPNRDPLWSNVLVPRLNRMRPWIFFPPGGTAMTSAQYVGAATRSLIEKYISGSIPIAEQNMDWDVFLGIVSQELYGTKRRVVTVPGQVAALYGIWQQVALRIRGLDSGLRYRAYLANVHAHRSWLPESVMDDVSEQLDIDRSGVEPSIRETFAKCRAIAQRQR